MVLITSWTLPAVVAACLVTAFAEDIETPSELESRGIPESPAYPVHRAVAGPAVGLTCGKIDYDDTASLGALLAAPDPPEWTLFQGDNQEVFNPMMFDSMLFTASQPDATFKAIMMPTQQHRGAPVFPVAADLQGKPGLDESLLLHCLVFVRTSALRESMARHFANHPRVAGMSPAGRMLVWQTVAEAGSSGLLSIHSEAIATTGLTPGARGEYGPPQTHASPPASKPASQKMSQKWRPLQDTLHPGTELLRDCLHGNYLVLKNDMYIGRSLREYGEWSQLEVSQVYAHYARPGSVVVDAGANIGAMTVPLAKMVGPAGQV
jgi:hypothetical protein